jgi:ribosomal protein L37AE/L43A
LQRVAAFHASIRQSNWRSAREGVRMDEAVTRLPGLCPECGSPVARIPESAGMWSGAEANGKMAGGAWWKAVCGGCGGALVAYWGVYREDGEGVEVPPDYEPELWWSRSQE